MSALMDEKYKEELARKQLNLPEETQEEKLAAIFKNGPIKIKR